MTNLNLVQTFNNLYMYYISFILYIYIAEYHNHNVDLMLKYRFWFWSDRNKFIYFETRIANTIDNLSNVSPWVFTYLIVMVNVSFFQVRSFAIAQTGKTIRVLKTTIFSLFELHSTNMNVSRMNNLRQKRLFVPKR